MKLTLMFGMSVLLACSAPAGEAVIPAYKSTLTGATAPELPAKAAALVKESKAPQQQAVTVSVVQTAVTHNPAAAPAIVGAVARAVPDMAAQAGATAASLQPKQAAAITKAAVAAAPSKAGKIVDAICRVVPNSYRAVAMAAAKAAPGSKREILNAVASAIPELKSGIEKNLAAIAGNFSVAAVLDSASRSATVVANADSAASVSTARGPAVGPPYIPISGTPVNTTPANSTDVPPGGRDYTQP